ncbi:hypothetical protein NC652_019572 [Populus alba x Populus x berolinensis]|nr:hypothetical protein NC652_019572 [Populus alba x Populus x berolinensis]
MTGRRRYKSAKHSGLAKENKRGGEDQGNHRKNRATDHQSILLLPNQSCHQCFCSETCNK